MYGHAQEKSLSCSPHKHCKVKKSFQNLGKNERTGKRESGNSNKGKRVERMRGCGKGLMQVTCNNAFRPRHEKNWYVCVLLFKARKLAIAIDPDALPCPSQFMQFADRSTVV